MGRTVNHLLIPDDYNEASAFFTQSLGNLVANAKLDRPLDSHAPQTEYMYHYDDDDWGEQDEYEAKNQWDEQDDGYQEENTYESYPTEAEDPDYEREDPDGENEHNQGEMLEEDDQDTHE
jgi:hypothetical protein